MEATEEQHRWRCNPRRLQSYPGVAKEGIGSVTRPCTNKSSRRASSRCPEGHPLSQHGTESVCQRDWLRSGRNPRGLRERTQQRMHELVAIRRRTNHSKARGTDDSLHLPGIAGHQGGCTSRFGTPIAFVEQPLLERLMPEANRHSKVLGKRGP